MNVTTVAEALEKLPLGQAKLMEFEYVELSPLTLFTCSSQTGGPTERNKVVIADEAGNCVTMRRPMIRLLLAG